MTYKIIGHRGDKANYRENTLSGFKSSLETEGVDGIELDVVVTKDKVIVLSHDPFLKDSSNKKYYIKDLTYTELLTLGNQIENELSQESIKYPTLESLFELYTTQTQKKTILIEIKSMPSVDVHPLTIPELIKDIHTLISKYGILNDCYIISFDYRMIQESYKLNPNMKIGLILNRNLVPLSSILNTLKISLIIMEKSWITKEQVNEMVNKNIEVYTWTPNTQNEWTRLANLGVHGLITDKPKALSLFRKNLKSRT